MYRASTVSLTAVVAALALSACGLLAGVAMAEPPDRSTRPALGTPPDVTLPQVRHFTLESGVPVLLLEKHDVPLVQTNVIMRAGSADDPSALVGLAELTAAMLNEGAGGRGALELADALEHLGARYFAAAAVHTTAVGIRVGIGRWEEALGLLAEMLLAPDFPEEELERQRASRLTSLIRSHDQPALIAGALFQRSVFGAEHPYGRFGLVESALRAISVEDLRDFHERYYRGEHATLIVVGAVDAATAKARLEEAFDAWTPRDGSAVGGGGRRAATRTQPEPAVPVREGRAVWLVDKPESPQSIIRVGHLGAARDSEDYYALQVLNTVLGGSFTSRLNQNLREDKGYSYGARSTFDYGPWAGPFFATAAVFADVTGPALTEFMNELHAIREQITEEEIDLARNFLASRFAGGFEAVSGIAGQLADLVLYELPLDYYDGYVERIRAVTSEDVARVAADYIDPDNLAIVVVGDRTRVEHQIRELELAPVEVLDVADVLGALPVLIVPEADEEDDVGEPAAAQRP